MRLPRVREYPKSIRIKDADYKIKFVRKLGSDTVGDCCPSDHIIRIKLKQSALETYKTFIHEVIHAMEEEYNIKMTHKAVYQLEEALADLLITNF